MIRKPVVAGTFYPASPKEIDKIVASVALKEQTPIEAKAVILPHAGYVYSGATAWRVLANAHLPPRLLLLGPNHTGLGAQVALADYTAWESPYGIHEVDPNLQAALAQIDGLALDTWAHQREHSLEVELPLLAKIQPGFRFSALTLSRLNLKDCLRLGESIASIFKSEARNGQPVGLVISTDMSHFLEAKQARQVDSIALKAIEQLDPTALFHLVHEHEISMCGVIPTVVGLVAALQLGATQAKLIEYTHSGVASGDLSRVVGYAGFVIS